MAGSSAFTKNVVSCLIYLDELGHHETVGGEGTRTAPGRFVVGHLRREGEDDGTVHPWSEPLRALVGWSTVLRLRGAVMIGALRRMATDAGKAWAAEATVLELWADGRDIELGRRTTLETDLARLRAAWLRLGAALLGQA